INLERRIVRWDTAGINKNAVAYLTTTFTKFIPTSGPATVRWEAVRAGVFSVSLPGWYPIRSYADLATVWYADAIIEGSVPISGGEKISSVLEEEIKMTSVKIHGLPAAPGSGFKAPQ